MSTHNNIYTIPNTHTFIQQALKAVSTVLQVQAIQPSYVVQAIQPSYVSARVVATTFGIASTTARPGPPRPRFQPHISRGHRFDTTTFTISPKSALSSESLLHLPRHLPPAILGQSSLQPSRLFTFFTPATDAGRCSRCWHAVAAAAALHRLPVPLRPLDEPAATARVKSRRANPLRVSQKRSRPPNTGLVVHAIAKFHPEMPCA